MSCRGALGGRGPQVVRIRHPGDRTGPLSGRDGSTCVFNMCQTLGTTGVPCPHRSVSVRRRTTSASCARPGGPARAPLTRCVERCGCSITNADWPSSAQTLRGLVLSPRTRRCRSSPWYLRRPRPVHLSTATNSRSLVDRRELWSTRSARSTRILVDQIRSIDVDYVVGDPVDCLTRDRLAEVELALAHYLGCSGTASWCRMTLLRRREKPYRSAYGTVLFGHRNALAPQVVHS